VIPVKSYTLAVIRGDGIGPEIVDEAVKVLDTTGQRFGFRFEYRPCLMGGHAIDETGVPLPPETVDICKSADAVLLGAVGGDQWDALPGPLRPEAGLLGLRAALGLYANLRPAKVFAPLAGASPLRREIVGDGLDILVVRELTGGIYFGQRGRFEREGVPAAFDTEMYTAPEIERIARVGFAMARMRSGRLCSVDKANVLESSRLWRETVARLAADYPDVALTHMYVDNCAMQLVRNPRQFDVIVTSNMFGDILSDEASMLSGSIGMLPSASLAGGAFGLYEPIHGSAPDIAGQGSANPLAMILSAAMLLRHSLGEPGAAAAIEAAVDAALCEVRTPDIHEEGYRRVSTWEMGDAVCAGICSAGG